MWSIWVTPTLLACMAQLPDYAGTVPLGTSVRPWYGLQGGLHGSTRSLSCGPGRAGLSATPPAQPRAGLAGGARGRGLIWSLEAQERRIAERATTVLQPPGHEPHMGLTGLTVGAPGRLSLGRGPDCGRGDSDWAVGIGPERTSPPSPIDS